MLKIENFKNYEDFKLAVRELLSDESHVGDVNLEYKATCQMDSDFQCALEEFAYLASNDSDDRYKEIRREIKKEIKGRMKQNFRAISDQLSFRSLEEAHEKMPPVWGQSDCWFYTMMNLGFYGLAVSDAKIGKRFEVVYELDRNKIECGSAGFSEKLEKELPYYFTYFDSKPLLIDPIKGEVYKFAKMKGLMGLCVEDGKVYAVISTGERVLLAEALGIFGLKVYEPITLNTSDMRASERERKRESGKKIKETPWRSVQLGYLRGSLSCIREHSLIALMVYGMECMKYAIMDGSSILTVDHINGQHDDNRVDNFALLTRRDNDAKGGEVDNDAFYFDFFPYFMNSGFR